MEMNMSKVKVLFVCLGNICRSPAAEGIFADLVAKEGLREFFEIDSAGTSAHHQGERADERMRKAATERGYNLTSISRQFVKNDFKNFDHIIVMDKSNYRNVMNLDPDNHFEEKVSFMTDYVSNFSESEVPDPYWSGDEGFFYVIDLLEDATSGFLNKLRKEDKL
jgi:protein-tyrosine phosphatase